MAKSLAIASLLLLAAFASASAGRTLTQLSRGSYGTGTAAMSGTSANIAKAADGANVPRNTQMAIHPKPIANPQKISQSIGTSGVAESKQGQAQAEIRMTASGQKVPQKAVPTAHTLPSMIANNPSSFQSGSGRSQSMQSGTAAAIQKQVDTAGR